MITTVNPKGQVTIPEPLWSRYGFPPGTKVVWLERDGDLIPKPSSVGMASQPLMRPGRTYGPRSVLGA
jgi:bifunctional DNA-binding transcriptional regulator/antitoxin component of YhaV-PrlF toxin-antitoxin module